MSDKAVIAGEFVTFQHLVTRKVVALRIEVPEESFEEVFKILGMPSIGNSKPVAVCLLDKSKIPTKTIPEKVSEKTEGEKLVIRAVLTCKDISFQRFVSSKSWYLEGERIKWECTEEGARQFILNSCGIKSRSELATNKIAQEHFKAIDRDYKNWLNPVDDIYKDNLERL